MNLGRPLTVIVILLACMRGASAAPPEQIGHSHRVEFIRVSKDLAGSHVGHVGLRIDDSVYHYRALKIDDLLTLRRFRWDDFVERYVGFGDLSLNLQRLSLSDEAAMAIEDRLKRLHSIQEKQFDRLDALRMERDWFAVLESPNSAPPLLIGGLGYFDSTRAGPETRHLRERIDARTGRTFVPDALAQVTAELQRSALEVSLAPAGEIDPGEFPTAGELAAERRRDHLILREALLILDRGAALDESALLRPAGAKLNSHERSALRSFAEGLEESIARLLRSRRPDRGTPLIVATARYLTVRRSLEENQFVFLDRLPDEVTTFGKKKSHRKMIESLAQKMNDGWLARRAEIFAPGTAVPDEFRFGLLEKAGTRCAELSLAKQRGSARFGSVHGLPSRAGAATPPPAFELDPTLLAAARTRSSQIFSAYKKSLHQAHEFHLLRHNCATEITRTIRSAFPDDATAIDALGGEIIPGKGGAMIPSILARKIRKHWRVIESRVIRPPQ